MINTRIPLGVYKYEVDNQALEIGTMRGVVDWRVIDGLMLNVFASLIARYNQSSSFMVVF